MRLPRFSVMSINHIRRPLAALPTAGHYSLYSPTDGRFVLQTKCMSADQLPYAPHGWFRAPIDEPIGEGEEG
jgi:hypothetical protein